MDIADAKNFNHDYDGEHARIILFHVCARLTLFWNIIFFDQYASTHLVVNEWDSPRTVAIAYVVSSL